MVGIGESSRDGSKFPCSVIFPPERYRAFLAEQVQSTPKADAFDFAISPNANQHPFPKTITRSEEHTSELQSRENLVCRLLLEKKKKKSQLQINRCQKNTTRNTTTASPEYST